jgi:hypothetical protein
MGRKASPRALASCDLVREPHERLREGVHVGPEPQLRLRGRKFFFPSLI